MNLPNIDEIKEQNLVPEESQEESETSQKTEETEQEETVEETEEESSESKTEEVEEETKKEEVPASYQKRINELVYKHKSAEERVSALESELQKIHKSSMTDEEKKEDAAREYLRGLLREELVKQKEEEKRADDKLNDEINLVTSQYPDFNEKQVLEVMRDYEIPTVEGAYKAWKQMNRKIEETKEETRKKIISKPKSPSSVKTSDDFGSKFSQDKTKDMSLFDLAQLAKKEAGLD